VNKAKFQALPDDLQAIVRYAAAATAQDTTTDFTFHNIQAFRPLIDDYGIELRTFSDDIVKRLGSITMEVIGEIGETDALTQKIHASFMDFTRRAADYQGAFEETMLRQRRLVWEG
jgi:TRAP-type mannitol/chloroaromatic compound transport system substrate-binding protein